jgi:hypothetical protein
VTSRGLVEFLLDRIAGDQAVARAAFWTVDGREVGDWHWSNAGDAVFVDDSEHPVACGPGKRLMHQPFASHIGRWDPERVVRERAAKRQVVEHASGSRASQGMGTWMRPSTAASPMSVRQWAPTNRIRATRS